MSSHLQDNVLETQTLKAAWLPLNQVSVRNLSAKIPHSVSPSHAPKKQMSASVESSKSDSYAQNRLKFMKGSSLPENEPVSFSVTTTANSQVQQILDQQQTGIALDKISVALHQALSRLPLNVGFDAPVDVCINQVRMKGVRVITTNESLYRHISRDVNLCQHVHDDDPGVFDANLKSLCATVSVRSIFTPPISSPFPLPALHVRKVVPVDVMTICESMPLCFSPSFAMNPKILEHLRTAISFTEVTRNLRTYEVRGASNAVGQDSIILSPRHVGGNILSSLSTFCSSKQGTVTAKHEVNSVHNAFKHPRFGMNLCDHMDFLVSQVHDNAKIELKSWLRSACDSDETYKAILQSPHCPTTTLTKTEHCAYMAPLLGMTVLLQKNQFLVSSAALIRYGMHVDKSHTMNVDTVSIMFHGPTIHKK
jgi:hypothetical protein